MKKLRIDVDGIHLDFETAKAFADVAAGKLSRDFMVIAWYDGQKKEEHPSVPECQHKPGWLAYAEGHGGNIMVELNSGEFFFVFNAMDYL